MTDPLDTKDFGQLFALRALTDDNTLALLENSISLQFTERLKSVTTTMSQLEDVTVLVEGMRRVNEVVGNRRSQELDYLREVINRRALFDKYESILKKGGLWRKPILHLPSKK